MDLRGKKGEMSIQRTLRNLGGDSEDSSDEDDHTGIRTGNPSLNVPPRQQRRVVSSDMTYTGGRGIRRPGNQRGTRSNGSSYTSRTHQSQNRAANRNKKAPMDERLFTSLLQKEPPEVALELGSREEELLNILNQQWSVYAGNTCVKADRILGVLAIACKCESAAEHLIKILVALNQSAFLKTTLSNYIIDEYSTVGSRKVTSLHITMGNLLVVVRTLLLRIPSSVTTVFGVIELVSQFSQQSTEEIRSALIEVKELGKAAFTKYGEEVVNKDNKNKDMDPPSDFRELSIFPCMDDFKDDKEPFLRANKAKGRYDNLDHYLDIQFRLLKEDFLCPLREGICEYRESVETGENIGGRFQKIRVYTGVHVVCPSCTNDGVAYRLKFDSNLTYVNWATTRRLMFGSLVCLSEDGFQTLIFGTVTKSGPELLAMGLVDVRCYGDANILSMSMKYDMVETTAYFEAYRHVLSGLRNTYPGHLPMEEHIVACKTDVAPPAYLANGTIFDLRPLFDTDIIIKKTTTEQDTAISDLLASCGIHDFHRPTQQNIEGNFSTESSCVRAIDILVPSEWPSADLLRLDASQMDAFQQALTHNIAMIQGPPGTGKTYLGLKIMKTLLYNKDVWADDTGGKKENKPILIVCYTNHALDQFLEGISKFYEGDIVRVGGRSKSEIVKEFALAKYRNKFRGKIPQPYYIHSLNMRIKVMELKAQIHSLSLSMVMARNHILHERTLRAVMGHHFTSIKNEDRCRFNMEGYLAPWLGLQNDVGELYTSSSHGRGQDLSEVEEYVSVIQSTIDQRLVDEGEEKQHDIFDATLPPDFIIAFNTVKKREKPKGKKRQYSVEDYVLWHLNDPARMTAREASGVLDVWTMSIERRWKLYKYWVDRYCEKLSEILHPLKERYQELAELYIEAQNQSDREILKTASIIGMTTTGAAKYQGVLRDIGPKIVVVEEAAEVLESHIITAISPSCEHLILIGDHKQLRPNPTTFKLARDYNFDISLFERMISNKLDYKCLQLQHRMHPDISVLMRHIYPDLVDHDIVKCYGDVKGVRSNLFFVHHTEFEESDEETRSHANRHEAAFIAEFFHYLTKQGYSESQITILAAYSGQEQLIRKMLPRNDFADLRITTVDNFQGEENDIILLSLVRSNPEGKVGFLKEDNRVCVALSRAKCGLYVMGNFEQLSKISPLWGQIGQTFQEKGCFGSALKLVCSNHPKDGEILVSNGKEFSRMVPDGGCIKMCGFRLDCGHACRLHCHPFDNQHETYRCEQPCGKACPQGHKCQKRCCAPCGDCMVLIPTVMPRCGHDQRIPCSTDKNRFSCQADCPRELRCGHPCSNSCGKPHTHVECYHVITKKFTKCGHDCQVLCGEQLPLRCPLC